MDPFAQKLLNLVGVKLPSRSTTVLVIIAVLLFPLLVLVQSAILERHTMGLPRVRMFGNLVAIYAVVVFVTVMYLIFSNQKRYETLER